MLRNHSNRLPGGGSRPSFGPAWRRRPSLACAAAAVAAAAALLTAVSCRAGRWPSPAGGSTQAGANIRDTAFSYVVASPGPWPSRKLSGAGNGNTFVRRHAELPDVGPEPNPAAEFGRLFGGAAGVGVEKSLTPEDRVTPIDRWFGWDKLFLRGRDTQGFDDGSFVDSSDAANYVTVWLEKPLGVEFIENTPDEGGGVMVEEVIEDYSASDSGMVLAGYHLIAADDTPVYGLPFDEAIKPIIDSEGYVKLTFFTGEAVHFYGEFRPASAWLSDFLEQLKQLPPPEEQ